MMKHLIHQRLSLVIRAISDRISDPSFRIPHFAFCIWIGALILLMGLPAYGQVATFRVGGIEQDLPDSLWMAWTSTHTGAFGEVRLVYQPELVEPRRGRVEVDQDRMDLDLAEDALYLQPIRLEPHRNLALGWGEGHFKEELGFWRDPPAWFERMFDGDRTTYLPGRALRGWWPVYLEKQYRINRVRLVLGEQPLPLPDTLGAWQVMVAPVSFDSLRFWTGGMHIYEIPEYKEVAGGDILTGIGQYPEQVLDVPFDEHQEALYVKVFMGRDVVRMAEFELYGDGFVPYAEYRSPVIDIGPRKAIWGRIRWTGETIEEYGDTETAVYTRTGLDPDPLVYQTYTRNVYVKDLFLKRAELATEVSPNTGLPLSREEWLALPTIQQVPLEELPYDREHWSYWSDPYAFQDGLVEDIGDGGVSIASPGPRQYVQFRIVEEPALRGAARFKQIAFEFAPPLARRVSGEITPSQAPLEQEVRFTYAVRPDTISRLYGDPGFDVLEIAVPDTNVTIDSVRVDGVDVPWMQALFTEGGQSWLRVQSTEQRLDETGELLEVGFRAKVFRTWTRFAGRVRDSGNFGIFQTVEPGNVSARSEEDDIVVRTAVGKRLLGDVEISSRGITPNGDGSNDRLNLRFTVFRMSDLVSKEGEKPFGGERQVRVPLSVEVLDLSGRVVKTLFHTDAARVGVYESPEVAPWNGTDNGEERVLPGIYLYRVQLEADSGDEVRMGTVAVVY